MQVVDVALVVKKILLVVALDLNPAQAFFGEIFGVVDVNDVILVFFAVHLLVVFPELLLGRLFLQSKQLALRQIFKVNLVIGKGVVIVLLLIEVFVVSELIDLVLQVRGLTDGRIHQKFGIVVQGHLQVHIARVHLALFLLLVLLTFVLVLDLIADSFERVAQILLSAESPAGFQQLFHLGNVVLAVGPLAP